MNDQSKKTSEEKIKTTKRPIRDLKPLSKEVPKGAVIVKTTASSLREEYTQSVMFWESLVSLNYVAAKKTLEDLILETAIWESEVSRRFSFVDVEAWKKNRLQDVEELFKDWENSHNGCADASKTDSLMSRFAIKLHEVFMRRRFIEVDVLAQNLNIAIKERHAQVKELSFQLKIMETLAKGRSDLSDTFYKSIVAMRTIIEGLEKEQLKSKEALQEQLDKISNTITKQYKDLKKTVINKQKTIPQITQEKAAELIQDLAIKVGYHKYNKISNVTISRWITGKNPAPKWWPGLECSEAVFLGKAGIGMQKEQRGEI